MPAVLKFVSIHALVYVALAALGASVAFAAARAFGIERLPNEVGLIFLVLSWCFATGFAVEDGLTKRRMKRGRLSPEKTMRYLAYSRGLALQKRVAAACAAGFGVIFHLVVAGATLTLLHGEAFLSDIRPVQIIVQAVLFYVLTDLILPRPRSGGAGGAGAASASIRARLRRTG